MPSIRLTCPTGPSALDKPKDRRERRSKQGLWPSLRIVEQLAKTGLNFLQKKQQKKACMQ